MPTACPLADMEDEVRGAAKTLHIDDSADHITFIELTNPGRTCRAHFNHNTDPKEIMGRLKDGAKKG